MADPYLRVHAVNIYVEDQRAKSGLLLEQARIPHRLRRTRRVR
jgi:hypothetical protein